MLALLHWLKKELIEVLPGVLYFFVAFSLIYLTENLMLRGSGIRYASFSNVIVGALVVGKVILVVDLYPFVNAFNSRPLIYNTLWKTGLYSITALLYRLGELAFKTLSEYKGSLVVREHILSASAEPRFWAIQLWVVMLLLIFVAAKELISAIGIIRIRQLFFGH